MRPSHLLAALCLAASLAAPASAKEYKAIRFGMDASFAPFESVNQQGQIVGFEVDYANAICARIKVTCTFQNQDWDGIIPSLLSSKFDVIFSSMDITPERQRQVIFSDMYYATLPVFIGQSSIKGNDVSPVALRGKTIGAQSSTTHAVFLEKLYAGSELKLYPTADESNLDLASGRLDYVVGDALVETDFVEQKGKGCCRVIAEVARIPDIHGPGVGAAFRPDDAELRDLFNKTIAELDADGTFKTVAAKYFKMDIRGK